MWVNMELLEGFAGYLPSGRSNKFEQHETFHALVESYQNCHIENTKYTHIDYCCFLELLRAQLYSHFLEYSKKSKYTL